jgi:hypothetical protein
VGISLPEDRVIAAAAPTASPFDLSLQFLEALSCSHRETASLSLDQSLSLTQRRSVSAVNSILDNMASIAAPPGIALMLMLQDHANHALPDFRGISFLLLHCSIPSRI